MAHVQHQGLKWPLAAASAVADKKVVVLDTTANQAVPAATNNVRPLGVTIASGAQGDSIAVYGHGNTVKAVAAASLGFGSEVGVASTNGNLGPITGASGVTKWAVGQALESAAAGETFSLLVSPRQLSNLI
jgi:hypothetical protein